MMSSQSTNAVRSFVEFSCVMPTEAYEIYALRDTHHHLARENLLSANPHDDRPIPLDNLVRAIVGDDCALALDTAFDQAKAKKRRRELLRPRLDGPLAIGVDPRA
jgi:hypothetical protein